MPHDARLPLPDDAANEFSYFMIRLRRVGGKAAGGAADLCGVVERLGSGEKRSFEASRELVELLEAWTTASGPSHDMSR